ncbi:MAG: hypothetical protein Kow009_14070 [Spirochaetales bacterium]
MTQVRNRLKTRTLCSFLLLFLIFLPLTLYGQEDETTPYVPTYVLGNQMLIINAGLFVPLFFQSLGGEIDNTNLSLGGVGSIQWSTYLNNQMTLGVEGGGMFAFSPNGRTLFMLPVTARYAYLLRAYPFEFPLSISAGINFTRLSSMFKILPIVKPGVSVYWNYSLEWAFGVNFFYWWTPNLYLGPEPPKSESRFGNFLEISLSALYHF